MLSLLGIGQLTNYGQIVNINPIEFAYPSDPNIDISQKQYSWSALCKRVVDPDLNSRLVQVTVFVCRKVGTAAAYWNRDPCAPPALITVPSPVRPVPVWIDVSQPAAFNPDMLLVVDADPADPIN